jgi:hypothetical protein
MTAQGERAIFANVTLGEGWQTPDFNEGRCWESWQLPNFNEKRCKG